MPRFIIEVKRNYEYAVPIEADNEYDAIQLVRDYEIEDLEEYETNAYWVFDAEEAE
jgi:hypothetical protein